MSFYGCRGDRIDIQKLAIVMAIGIDITSDNKYQVTLQILNPEGSIGTGQGMGGGSSSDSASSDVSIFTQTGDTVLDAIYDASRKLGRSHHFGHAKYLVIGETLARKGVSDALESMLRIVEFRPNTPLFVTKGTASSVLLTTSPESKIPANLVENLFQRQLVLGISYVSYVLQFINGLEGESKVPIAAVLEAQKSAGKTNGEVFKISGAGVFKKDKLIGFLNEKEASGLQWILGHLHIGEVTDYSDKFGRASFRIVRADSKIKTFVEGDKVSVVINIKNTSELNEVFTKIDPIKNPDILLELEQRENETIKKEVELALNAGFNDLKVDIFDFAQELYRQHPKEWKKIKNNYEDIFPNIGVTVNVNSVIKGTGITPKSLKE